MIYQEKKYKEIFKEMIQESFKNHLISYDSEFVDRLDDKEDISNFYVMLLSIHAEAFEDVYKEMTKVYNSSKIRKAEGVDLDDIGIIVNCPRPQSTCAGVELLFSSNHDYNDVVSEPEGILVRTNSRIVYKTLEPIEFTPNSNSCLVQAVAVESGSQSHVAADTLKKIETDLVNIGYVSVTNPEPSTGGTDGFNDEQYRELLKNWVKTKQKGNEWAYKEYFARLDILDDYKIIPNWDGSGTIKTIITPDTPFLLNKVYTELQSEVTQASEDIVVLGPVEKQIDVHVNCNVDIDRINPFSASDKENIKYRIQSEINNYISNMGIGEDFIPHKLGVYIDEHVSELKNIVFEHPQEYVVVSDEEKCVVGNIEINMR